jgi:hypothetical protein
LFPHFGQNFTDGGKVVPQRLQLSPEETCFPQFPQKVAPLTIGALQCGQFSPPDSKGLPQLTQRLAFLSLSVPHFGQGLYSSPQ